MAGAERSTARGDRRLLGSGPSRWVIRSRRTAGREPDRPEAAVPPPARRLVAVGVVVGERRVRVRFVGMGLGEALAHDLERPALPR